MINRRHRFHGHGSLRFVYTKGQQIRGNYLSTKFIINERRTIYRLAVVVSKKVSKSAVVRNRIRRRIYEQVRVLSPAIHKPYDIVISVYSDRVQDMPSPELSQLVHDQLHQAGIIAGQTTPAHGKIESKGE